jgi:hypothetical protein
MSFVCHNMQNFLILFSIASMGRMLMIFKTPMMMKANPMKTVATAKRIPSQLGAVSPSKSTTPQLQQLIWKMMKMTCKLPLLCFLQYFFLLLLCSVITPPPTPSPTKAASGKKRTQALANCESDDDDVFVPRYDI